MRLAEEEWQISNEQQFLAAADRIICCILLCKCWQCPVQGHQTAASCILALLMSSLKMDGCDHFCISDGFSASNNCCQLLFQPASEMSACLWSTINMSGTNQSSVRLIVVTIKPGHCCVGRTSMLLVRSSGTRHPPGRAVSSFHASLLLASGNELLKIKLTYVLIVVTAAVAHWQNHDCVYRLHVYKWPICVQLVDDLLDFTSSENIMGKPAAADLKLGLATAPVLFASHQVGLVVSWDKFPFWMLLFVQWNFQVWFGIICVFWIEIVILIFACQWYISEMDCFVYYYYF